MEKIRILHNFVCEYSFLLFCKHVFFIKLKIIMERNEERSTFINMDEEKWAGRRFRKP